MMYTICFSYKSHSCPKNVITAPPHLPEGQYPSSCCTSASFIFTVPPPLFCSPCHSFNSRWELKPSNLFFFWGGVLPSFPQRQTHIRSVPFLTKKELSNDVTFSLGVAFVVNADVTAPRFHFRNVWHATERTGRSCNDDFSSMRQLCAAMTFGLMFFTRALSGSLDAAAFLLNPCPCCAVAAFHNNLII